MSDHLGGLVGANYAKPHVLAEAIVNAAQERMSGMTPAQKPHTPVGVIKAGASHLCKREQRETGAVHPGSPAARAQAVLAAARGGGGRGDDNDAQQVVNEVSAIMEERGLGK